MAYKITLDTGIVCNLTLEDLKEEVRVPKGFFCETVLSINYHLGLDELFSAEDLNWITEVLDEGLQESYHLVADHFKIKITKEEY